MKKDQELEFRTIEVVETYEAIQGEGIHIGTPVIIVRLGGCNLGCWYCDTPQRNDYKTMTFEEIKQVIDESKMDNVLITGGEPFLQINQIKEFIKWTQKEDLTYRNKKVFHIETNGTLYDEEITGMNTIITISPKFNYKREGINETEYEEYLTKIKQYTTTELSIRDKYLIEGKISLKFLIPKLTDTNNREVLRQTLNTIEEVRRYNRGINIVLQPLYQEETIQEIANWAKIMQIQIGVSVRALQNEVRIIPQTHKLIGMK